MHVTCVKVGCNLIIFTRDDLQSYFTLLGGITDVDKNLFVYFHAFDMYTWIDADYNLNLIYLYIYMYVFLCYLHV